MELAVEMIHFVVVLGVALPKLSVLGNGESADVRLIELLHLSHLEKAVIIIADALVPFQRSAFFNRRHNIVSLDDIVGNLRFG